MADLAAINEVLMGKVRGNPVAISHFPDGIPDGYAAQKVAPCAILRYAMDKGERAYFDRVNQDCVHGAFIAGVHEGTEQIRTGALLPDYIPAYTADAGYKLNSGEFVLPQGTVQAIGAAPLADVPEGIQVNWIAVVCTPFWASSIAAARSVEDGMPPTGAAGSSFCSELFVTPWLNENVVMTCGDMGGRMNNRLKPEEMFVIVPLRWADNLIKILDAMPDVKGLYEATLPEHSVYWKKQADREAMAAENRDASAVKAKQLGLTVSMAWDDDALEQVAQAPKFVRKFAVGNIEDFAADKGYQRVTAKVVTAQMESAGVSKFARFFKR
jgi:uncharacterized protein (DUF169 family)